MATVEQSRQTGLTSQQSIPPTALSRERKKVRAGILSNLRAGRSDTQVPRLRAFLKAHPHVAHAETHSPDEVPDALATLADREIDLLLVYGGDGTFQHVLTELLGHHVFGDRRLMIAPLRGGSTNMTSRDLGAHRDPIKGVAEVIKAIEEDRLDERLCQRKVLHVTSAQDDFDQYGMFFGAGIVYHGIEQVKRMFPTGPAQGLFGSTLVTGGLIFKRVIRRKNNGLVFSNNVRISLDGEPAGEEAYIIVMTSTLDRLISGIRPFWGTEPAPVRFTAVASRAERFGQAVLKLMNGKPNERFTAETGYTSHNIHQAELHLDCGFTIDGELHAPQEDRTLIITADDRLQFVRA